MWTLASAGMRLAVQVSDTLDRLVLWFRLQHLSLTQDLLGGGALWGRGPTGSPEQEVGAEAGDLGSEQGRMEAGNSVGIPGEELRKWLFWAGLWAREEKPEE